MVLAGIQVLKPSQPSECSGLSEFSRNTQDLLRLHTGQQKKWKRVWKLRLIESVNPEWKDLSEELMHRH